MNIDRLLRAVPPPERPGDPFLGRWREVEAKLGTSLPSDYKAFVRQYGLGEFMGYVRIWTPGAYDQDSRIEASAPDAIQNLLEFEDLPFPLWPAPDGLLPFGDTIDGDYLAWVTSGSPDEWQVTILERGMLYEVAHRFDCGLSDLLAGLATGEIQLPFVEGLLGCAHLFSPDERGPAPMLQMGWRLGPFGTGGEGRSTCRLGRR